LFRVVDREGRVSLPEAGRFSSVDGVWAMRSKQFNSCCERNTATFQQMCPFRN